MARSICLNRLAGLILVLVLALPIASLAGNAIPPLAVVSWAADSSINVEHAERDDALRVQIGSAPDMNAMSGISPVEIDVMGAITTLQFFPLVMKNANAACSPIPFNETVRFNMLLVQATQAWPCTGGGEGVVIAILDTGADSNHPDLLANLIPGATFVPGTSTTEDDHGHGTHVSGIAAGVANNGGIFGVAPRAKIMPVKVCQSDGQCYFTVVAAGIIWAANNGAQVINMSLGGQEDSPTQHDAVIYAYNRGVAIVCSAGNSGSSVVMYPGSYPEVIAVAATDINDNRWYLSTYGTWVDVAAPGVNIYSSVPGGGYESWRGTSMSSPHVAGVAALIRKLRPAWTAGQIYNHIIYNSVDDVGSSGYDIFTGWGRINALKAVNAMGYSATEALPVPEPAPSTFAPVTKDPTEFRPGVVLFKMRSGVALSAVLGEASIHAVGLQAEVAVAELAVMQLVVPAGEELYWLKHLRSLPGVEYAELDGIMYIQ